MAGWRCWRGPSGLHRAWRLQGSPLARPVLRNRWASPGGVDQDKVALVHAFDGGRQVFRGIHDLQWRAEDVGVFLQLIDGGDAEGVDGDQADAPLFAQFEV